MEKYIIRVTSRLGATVEKSLVLECDYSAVRHGQRLAAAEERLEVWRGDECIFASEELGQLRYQKTSRPLRTGHCRLLFLYIVRGGGAMNGKTTFERAFELADQGRPLIDIRAILKKEGYELQQLSGMTVTIQLGKRILAAKGKETRAGR